MSRPRLSRLALPVALAAVALVVGTAGSTAGASTAAARADHTRHAASCLRTVGDGSGARLDRAPDTSEFTHAQLRRLDRQLHARLAARGMTARSLRVDPTIRIPVHVHVIDGTSSRGPSKDRVVRQMKILNGGYNGAESARNTPTRFAFYLASFDRHTNNKWRTANPGGPVDHQMRRALHVGGRQDLNLYIATPIDRSLPGGEMVLGFSTLPWNAARHPAIDGVTVAQGTLPGGGLKSFNLGDTVVHEVGHWLGLLHTFEGGCSQTNDGVADTPAEAKPSLGCNTARDTCPNKPGNDPVHNFMDYSPDPCMNQFTPGQATRMTDEWLAYRTP